MIAPRARWIVALSLTGLGLGCGGQSGAPASGPEPDAQSVPIRRLTSAEFLASAGDLFPGMPLPSLTFIPDARVLGFVNVSSSQTGSLVWAEQYESAALKVATAAAADPTTLTGCDAATVGETACVQPYVFGLAKRAYRRPLTDVEQAGLWALFLNPENGDYPSRLTMTIAAVLLSPKFLFRPELGDPQLAVASGGGALTPWEVATRLSYLITGSIPDAELTAAADANGLGTADAIAAQARRLLALPRSQENLVRMHEMWLRIDSAGTLARDPKKYPKFTSKIATSMARESHLFLEDVMFGHAGTFADLLLAPYTFANADVAGVYGVPAPATEWDRVELDPATRSGILTQPSLLATLAKDVSDEGGTPIGTSVLRGKFVLEQFLCRTVPSPSAAIQAMFPPQDFTKTTRVASAAHQVSTVCASCHSTMDPLGLPFEHYDALGKWRDTDRGMPIDATGQVTVYDAKNNPSTVPFDGVPAMSKIIAELPETRACYVSQWFRFSTGKLNQASDDAYINWLAQKFTKDKKMVDILVDMVTSDGFRQLGVRSQP